MSSPIHRLKEADSESEFTDVSSSDLRKAILALEDCKKWFDSHMNYDPPQSFMEMFEEDKSEMEVEDEEDEE